jgi:queuine tRNA-ribosyltransferase
MGVGTPDDILEAVARGIDMFDCVLPTRAGRHGTAYTRHGRLNLKNARYADDPEPLDAGSKHLPSSTFSQAYLHHLVRANEILGMMLLTVNNVAYYQDLMAGLRKAIQDGRLADFIAETREGWQKGERDRGAEPEQGEGAD